MTPENPFLPPPDERDPNRRFRGRLSGPVTVVTAGAGAERAGITVSSLVVIEGDPGLVTMVIGPLSDVWERIATTGRCIVHVCDRSARDLADVFALIRPSPGGPFTGVATTDTPWGPAIDVLPTRAYGTVTTTEEVGWSGLVTATIDRVEIADLTDPLLYFRGTYRGLA